MRKESRFYYDFYLLEHFLKRFYTEKSALKFANSSSKSWTIKKVKKRKLSTKEKE